MNDLTVFRPGSKVVVYLRDSGGPHQEQSVPQQQAVLKTWALEHQVTITAFYIDAARTGRDTVGRGNFMRMINHFRQPMVEEDGVLLWSFSRFARDNNDAGYFKYDLRRRGFIVAAIQDPVPEGVDGIVHEALIDWKNARYSLDMIEDVKRALHLNFEDYGAIGGNPPPGFKRDEFVISNHRDHTQRKVSKWVPDPDKWDICKLAWQMRAEGKTYKEIHQATHLYGSINSYVDFFQNDIYRGILHFGEKTVPGYVDAMIDEDTWNTVRSFDRKHNNPMGGQDNKRHPRRLNSDYLLTGIVYCARCGAPMYGKDVTATEGYKYQYYKCSRSDRRLDCDALQIPKEALERSVLNQVQNYILNPEMVYQRQMEVLEDRASQASELNIRKRDLNHQIGIINKQIGNVTEVIKTSGTSAISLVTTLEDLEKTKKDLENNLFQILDEELFEVGSLSAEEARANANLIKREMMKKDPREMKEMLRNLISHISAEKDSYWVRGLIQFYGPPDKLASGKDNNGPDDEELDKKYFMRKGGTGPGAPDHTHKKALRSSVRITDIIKGQVDNLAFYILFHSTFPQIRPAA